MMKNMRNNRRSIQACTHRMTQTRGNKRTGSTKLSTFPGPGGYQSGTAKTTTKETISATGPESKT